LRKHLYLSLKKLATLSVFKQQLKRLAKSRNRRSCCSHCNCCDDSTSQYLHPSNGEEELYTNDIIAPPKTPDNRPNEDDEDMLNTDEENGSENSTPPSQPRRTLHSQSPPRVHGENCPPTTNERNGNLPKSNLAKRGLKRKYTDHRTVENKIAD